MEPLPPSIAPTTAPAPPPSHHLSYPDSVDSSPRSRNTDSWDEPLPPAANRLRLMCSYGGHIVPRPHDKSLCYVGGDTRIVVVDRNTSLSDLTARLSKTLLNGRSFTLKYQLPSEDLDSLISVTTDEDLDNMIDEYDRTGNGSGSAAKPSRLRLFIFPTKPESSQSIGPILDNPAKSEDWFLNALNGATGMINRGFSDSASVNCLLGLDDEVGGGGGGSNVDSGSRDVEISQPGIGSFGNGKSGKLGILQDVHSVPDSPMLETSSSFGSTSSSPSLANLPPIRVHVEDGGGVRLQDQKLGVEEQFAQMSIGQVGVKPDESGFVVLSSPPPLPTTIVASAMPVSSATVVVDYTNRVTSDDERSDHGAPIVYRKQPLSQPLSQPVSQPQALPLQSHQKSSAGLEVPSPDSVSSDSSIGNALSRQKPVIYQEQVVQIPSGPARVLPNPVDPKVNISDPNTRVQLQQQVQDSGYVLQTQFDLKQQTQQQQQQQQQFVHAGAQYVHHHPAGSVPISAYYPVYPSQQQHHPHHHHQQQLDPQYSVYYVPARQAEAYSNMSVQQSNISGAATTIPSNHPQTHSNPTMAPPPHSYNPIRNPPINKPEIATGMYRTATGSPPLVQVPSAQHQQQYVGYSQIHHPSQSVAPTSAATTNYAYEYTDPAHSPIYYTQPLAPTMASQYQTMTGNAGVVLPEVSAQHPADNLKHQQHLRTSQPL